MTETFDVSWAKALPKLRKIAADFSRCHDDAEDLIADLRFNLLRRYGQFKPDGAHDRRFLSWSIRSIVRLEMDRKRKASRSPQTCHFDDALHCDGYAQDFTGIYVETFLDQISDQRIRSLIGLKLVGEGHGEAARFSGIHPSQATKLLRKLRSEVA